MGPALALAQKMSWRPGLISDPRRRELVKQQQEVPPVSLGHLPEPDEQLTAQNMIKKYVD